MSVQVSYNAMARPPQLVFSLAISAGVNGENSGRARSDWPACHFGGVEKKTTLMNQFVAGT